MNDEYKKLALNCFWNLFNEYIQNRKIYSKPSIIIRHEIFELNGDIGSLITLNSKVTFQAWTNNNNILCELRFSPSISSKDVNTMKQLHKEMGVFFKINGGVLRRKEDKARRWSVGADKIIKPETVIKSPGIIVDLI
jgi:hypothetical protein